MYFYLFSFYPIKCYCNRFVKEIYVAVFNKNMIANHDKVGDALYNSKFYCNSNFGWDDFYEYINMYTFNLYGNRSNW